MKTPPLSRLASFDKPFMSLDPGQTTGFSYWSGLERLECGEKCISDIENFLDDYEVAQLVIENYRVYGSKMRVQGNLYTPRLIGRIEQYAEHNDIPLAKQMAAPVKAFCNDQKLKDWRLWVPGKKHAMDATRHGAYFLIFGDKDATLPRP